MKTEKIIINEIEEKKEEFAKPLESLNKKSKTLGPKSQEIVRQFFHKLYGPYVNRIAEKVDEWTENQTSPSIIQEEMNKMFTHFEPQATKKTFENVEKTKATFIAKGKDHLIDRVDQTFYDSSKKVLEADLGAVVTFAQKQTSKTNTEKEMAAA